MKSSERRLLLDDPCVVGSVDNGPLDTDWFHPTASAPDSRILRGPRAFFVTKATEGVDVPDNSVAAKNLLHQARKFGRGTCPVGYFFPMFNRARAKRPLSAPSEWPCARPTGAGPGEDETSPTSPDRAQIGVWR